MRPASIDDPSPGEDPNPPGYQGGTVRRSSGSKLGLGIAFVVLVVLGVVAATVGPMIFGMFNQDRLAKEGTPAPAKILGVSETNSRVNHRWVYELTLEVYPESGAPYQANVSQPFSELHAANLRSGGAAEVRYDPEDPKTVVVMSTGGMLHPRAMPKGAAATDAPKPDSVDPVCKQASECCLKVGGAKMQKSCKGFLNPVMPPDSCKAALDGYKMAAEAKGLSCD